MTLTFVLLLYPLPRVREPSGVTGGGWDTRGCQRGDVGLSGRGRRRQVGDGIMVTLSLNLRPSRFKFREEVVRLSGRPFGVGEE